MRRSSKKGKTKEQPKAQPGPKQTTLQRFGIGAVAIAAPEAPAEAPAAAAAVIPVAAAATRGAEAPEAADAPPPALAPAALAVQGTVGVDAAAGTDATELSSSRRKLIRISKDKFIWVDGTSAPIGESTLGDTSPGAPSGSGGGGGKDAAASLKAPQGRQGMPPGSLSSGGLAGFSTGYFPTGGKASTGSGGLAGLPGGGSSGGSLSIAPLAAPRLTLPAKPAPAGVKSKTSDISSWLQQQGLISGAPSGSGGGGGKDAAASLKAPQGRQGMPPGVRLLGGLELAGRDETKYERFGYQSDGRILGILTRLKTISVTNSLSKARYYDGSNLPSISGVGGRSGDEVGKFAAAFPHIQLAPIRGQGLTPGYHEFTVHDDALLVEGVDSSWLGKGTIDTTTKQQTGRAPVFRTRFGSLTELFNAYKTNDPEDQRGLEPGDKLIFLHFQPIPGAQDAPPSHALLAHLRPSGSEWERVPRIGQGSGGRLHRKMQPAVAPTVHAGGLELAACLALGSQFVEDTTGRTLTVLMSHEISEAFARKGIYKNSDLPTFPFGVVPQLAAAIDVPLVEAGGGAAPGMAYQKVFKLMEGGHYFGRGQGARQYWHVTGLSRRQGRHAGYQTCLNNMTAWLASYISADDSGMRGGDKVVMCLVEMPATKAVDVIAIMFRPNTTSPSGYKVLLPCRDGKRAAKVAFHSGQGIMVGSMPEKVYLERDLASTPLEQIATQVVVPADETMQKRAIPDFAFLGKPGGKRGLPFSKALAQAWTEGLEAVIKCLEEYDVHFVEIKSGKWTLLLSGGRGSQRLGDRMRFIKTVLKRPFRVLAADRYMRFEAAETEEQLIKMWRRNFDSVCDWTKKRAIFPFSAGAANDGSLAATRKGADSEEEDLEELDIDELMLMAGESDGEEALQEPEAEQREQPQRQPKRKAEEGDERLALHAANRQPLKVQRRQKVYIEDETDEDRGALPSSSTAQHSTAQLPLACMRPN